MIPNDPFLIVHIVSGGVALLSGAAAALARKGLRVHIIAGRIFVYSMLISAISALILSNIRPNPFLFGIGLFTLYLIMSGWVVVWKTPLAKRQKYGKIIGLFGMLSAVYLAYQALQISGTNVTILYLVFGSIMLGFSFTDLIRPLEGKKVIIRHGSRIGGAYIATTTAFIVVNNHFLPPLVAWLLPTLIGTPLITIALRKWSNRGNKKVQA